MCGISGIWHLDNSRCVSPSLIAQMTFTLRHRGPDDEGYLFVDTVTGHYEERRGRDTVPELQMPDVSQESEERYDLAFGFRRLSIIDLSPAGHQPMGNTDGSLWVVYNGEIYNYLELREELKTRGHTFRTATDTEVILCAYEEWGEACLERFNGMWAFALWDGRRQQLFCARDRFGIKPFYYVWDGKTFAFASEIKALLHMPDIIRRPNEPIIYDYLRYGRLDHSEETFFAGIKQLPPAHFLLLRPTRQFSLRRYWDLIPDCRVGLPLTSDAVYAERFYSLFEDAVRLRLRSDVPIGTCLSGGLDSSAIVCVANRLLVDENVIDPDLVGERQRTFSSCFDDRQYDERQYIQAVLALTGAEPNYTFPKGEELLDALPRLIWYQDEPFGSTSIYAQWRVMEKTAERGVKVLLDGQGGDELLAGYHGYFNYFWASLIRRGCLAEFLREALAYQRLYGVSLAWIAMRAALTYIPTAILATAGNLYRARRLGLDSDFMAKYRHRRFEISSHYQDPFNNHLYSLLTQYSLPALLHYEDRNSMAFSIEARVPFLDYRLVEYAFSLPADQRIKRGLTKAVLRAAFQGVLPESVRTRTDKMGFVTPERVWLSTELNGWIKDIISSVSFRTRGYFDIPQILGALEAHTAGQRDLTFLAWRWVNLEMWFQEMIDVA